MPSVNETWREFKRYSGDGLPGEPLNAQLPIGDPQSGQFNPTKRLIRETLLPLEESVSTVTALRDETQVLRDQTAGLISDAVAASNVPIYSSAAAVHLIEVPDGLIYFRTLGRETAGDGGGSYFVEVDDEPAHSGKTFDLNGRWFEATADPASIAAWTADATLTVRIPTDFPSLQAAIDATAHISPGGRKIVLMIESGHDLTGGVATVNANHGHYWIESEDAVVYLDDAFAGASDVGMSSNSKANNLFLVYNGTGPTLNCLIDMGHRGDTGYLGVWSATALIRPGCGVRNAGYNGLEWRAGFVTAYLSVWDGANQSGIRAAHTGDIAAQSATADDCCQAVDVAGPSTGAVDISRGGRIFFRNGSAQNSGAAGFNARRGSWFNAEEANFDNAAGDGGQIHHASHVIAWGMSIVGSRGLVGTGYGLWIRGGIGNISGAVITGSAARDSNGGVVDVRVGDSSPYMSGVDMDASRITTTAGQNVVTNIAGLPYFNGPTRYGVLWNAAVETPFNIGSFSASGASRGTQWNDFNTLEQSSSTTGSTTFQRWYNPNGSIGSLSGSGSGVTLNTTSDAQLKANPTPLAEEFDLDALFSALDAYGFDWRSAITGAQTGQHGYGLIAQEVYQRLPHLVRPGTGSPGSPGYVPWELDYSGLMPFILARLNQIAARVSALQAGV